MQTSTYRKLLTALFLVLICISLSPNAIHGTQAQSDSKLFPETGKRVGGRFLQYWEANGGLARQGYPISDELVEVSDADGKSYTVQYFERAVFELHPENAGTPYDVLLSLLGAHAYNSIYPTDAPNEMPNTTPGNQEFPQTGKRVGGTFLQYWQTNGGLAQFGYPLSDEFREKSALDNKDYTVQYFERAVFELHPENTPPYDVLLSQLGTYRYRARYAAQAAMGRVVSGPTMAVERSCHTSTLLKNGKLLVAGGMIREGNFSANAELYDPSTGKFTPTGDLYRARACHTATLLPDGKVLLVSGDWDFGLDSAELYDPATGKFTLTGSLNHKRYGSTATLLRNGKVLIAGGYDHGLLKSAELYDPSTGKFTPTGDLNEARSTAGASLLPDGKVLITGGGADGNVLATSEIYDPSTGRFTLAASMSLQRHKHAQVTLPNGQVMVVGGADGRDWRGQRLEAELYNPQTGRFTSTGSMQNRRFKLSESISLTANGNLLVSGGSDIVELYSLTSGQFSTAEGDVQAARYYQATTLLPDGTVFIAGGYDNAIAATNRTWLYKP